MTQPMIGPPIGVEPWKATNHSDMTLPRIDGAAPSWSVELPVAMNAMLAAPASASAKSSRARLGASAASATAVSAPAPSRTSHGREGQPAARRALAVSHGRTALAAPAVYYSGCSGSFQESQP